MIGDTYKFGNDDIFFELDPTMKDKEPFATRAEAGGLNFPA